MSIKFLLAMGVFLSLTSAQVAYASVSYEEVHEPPIGWNPVTATEAELNYYNYPPRPKMSDQLKAWEKIVSAPKWERPVFKKGLDRKPTPKDLGPLTASYSYGPWDGVVSNKPYDEVMGYWKQPIAATDVAHKPSYASTWIGLGGKNAPLVQMGTYSNATGSSSDYDVWYEIVGTNKDSGGSKTISLTHSAGDQYYGDLWLTFDTSGYMTAHFYISDQTRNTVSSFQVTGISGWAGVTSSAEWILERPVAPVSGLYYLSKVANVPFTCLAANYGVQYKPDPYDASTEYTRIKDSAGTQIAGCTTIDYNGYYEATWLGYGSGR